MAVATYESPMPVSPLVLFDWHASPGALERLLPPWGKTRVIARQGSICDGGTVVLSVPVGLIRRRWIARHFDCEPGRQFRDEQIRGPFDRWVHTHLCLPGDDAGRSRLVDRVEYELPMGLAGRLVGGWSARRRINRMFLFRHQRTAGDLHQLARHANEAKSRIILSGGSGLVGGALGPFLTAGGHRVDRLVRRPARADGEIAWDPAAGSIDLPALEGADAFVHLSGQNIAGGRWTDERKKALVRSRVETTRFLCQSLARLERRPRVLVSASAIGFYGDRGDQPIDESSPGGDGFLPDLCREWEAATAPAAEAGIRVVNLRIGVVLSSAGGALAKMLPAFRLGAGGPVGSGGQPMSWIALDDLIGAIHEAIFNPALTGPVNVTAPEPVANRQFARALGRALGRPALLPLPAPVVGLLFGEMGRTLLLGGARVAPAKLLGAGFEFRFPTLEPALRAELGTTPLPRGWGAGSVTSFETA